MTRDPYKYFRIEAQELLEQLSRAALDLEQSGSPELVARLLRLAHTLKGAARVVKRSDIGDRAHAIEDALAPLRGGAQTATRTLVDEVLGHLDQIKGHLAGLGLTQSEPAQPAPVERPGTEEVPRTIRVDIGEMDTLLNGFAEVHSQLASLRDGLRGGSGVRKLMDSLRAHLSVASGRNAEAGAGGIAGQGQASVLAEQAGTALDGLFRRLAVGMEQLDRELGQARDAAERLRLIPAGSLFVSLERAARDAAQAQRKPVRFLGSGAEIRLEAQVLAIVQAALAHAVRNAVVHGIEEPARRRTLGKPEQGSIRLAVTQRGRWIEFSCSDDGGGIDLEAVRRVAEQRSLLPPGARPAERDELLQLLLKGGISTFREVTGVAGRGIGMDVVRDAAEQLDGKLDLRSEAGVGTTLSLVVPLSAAALEGLLVSTGNTVATIPLEAVRRTLRVAHADIARSAQGESLIQGGRVLPFLMLTQALSGTAAPLKGDQACSAVIVEANGESAAIGVQRLLGTANVVLRPLPPLVPAATVVAGVSLDAEGNPQLVLDPARLVQAARRAGAPPAAAEAAAPTILVIDDSLTTRMLERSILESAGYQVDLAVSAEEALEKAAVKRYALFLVDVEMPGMDGFSFVERTRADAVLRDTPAILVTSRAAPEDLQRGREAGARGYVIKSEFNQGHLLARIAELVS